jgi:hypothetical protein
VTLYDVLGVAPGASPEEVRRAYLALARRHHPDVTGDAAAARTGAERRMQELNVAWATLRDPGKRKEYDAELARRRPAPRPASPPGERSPYGSRPRAPSGASVNFVPYYDCEPLDPADLDDTPLGAGPVPRWVQLLPPGLLVLALASLAVGLVVQLPPLVGLGVIAFSLATVSFLLAPLVAISRSSRRGR